MEVLALLGGLWFLVFGLLPIQIYEALGPVWTVLLILVIFLCVKKIRTLRHARSSKKKTAGHRRH